MTDPEPFVFEGRLRAKREAPAVARNRDAIAAVLGEVLPPTGLVLEVASGTGEHAVHFARAFPQLAWQPSDPDPEALASIAGWSDEAGLANVRAPLQLDAAAADWPVDRADAVLCINMVHISPWAATLGLLAGAARVLGPGGVLLLYGPYRQVGVETAPSNEAFDQSLKDRNPDWGLRWLEDVIDEARRVDLCHAETRPMPANNLSVIFRRL